jgi:hypothetical protein
VLVFLLFFWGPMPCMIWAAIIIELAQGILTGDGGSPLAQLLARARVPYAQRELSQLPRCCPSFCCCDSNSSCVRAAPTPSPLLLSRL